MNLFTDVRWEMSEGAQPNEAYKFNEEYDIEYLEDTELDKVVYPLEDWILVMYADERGFDDELQSLYDNFSNTLKGKYNTNKQTSVTLNFLELRREEIFKKETTLKQLLERISKGICYGRFNGLRRTDEYSYWFRTGNPVFRIIYST